MLLQSPENCYYALELRSFDYCSYKTWGELDTLRFIIEDYERHWGKRLSQSGQYPLCNTFVLQSEMFARVMAWVSQLYSKLYPWCVEFPNLSHFGHIGGIYERIMAYAIAGLEFSTVKMLNVSH